MASTNLTNIQNHTDLRFRIMQLNSLKEEQELELKRSAQELYESLQPLNMLKKSLSDFVSDKQVRSDAGTVGMNLGAEFLIGKLLGTNMSLKKYLGSLVLQKASDYLINKHPEKLAWGVEKLSGLFKSSKNGHATQQD
jgi:hypothetical protein